MQFPKLSFLKGTAFSPHNKKYICYNILYNGKRAFITSINKALTKSITKDLSFDTVFLFSSSTLIFLLTTKVILGVGKTVVCVCLFVRKQNFVQLVFF